MVASGPSRHMRGVEVSHLAFSFRVLPPQLLVTSSAGRQLGRAPQLCRALGPLPSSWPLLLFVAGVRAEAAACLGASGTWIRGKTQGRQEKPLFTSLSGAPVNRLVPSNEKARPRCSRQSTSEQHSVGRFLHLCSKYHC